MEGGHFTVTAPFLSVAVGMTIPVVMSVMVTIAAGVRLLIESAVRYHVYRHYLFCEYYFSTENATDVPDAFLHGAVLRQVRADMREK